jgi:hypothetical protein
MQEPSSSEQLQVREHDNRPTNRYLAIFGKIGASSAPIVTISLGEERIFRLSRPKARTKREFVACHGMVFITPYDTNLAWKHGVPHFKKYTGRRISITIRVAGQALFFVFSSDLHYNGSELVNHPRDWEWSSDREADPWPKRLWATSATIRAAREVLRRYDPQGLDLVDDYCVASVQEIQPGAWRVHFVRVSGSGARKHDVIVCDDLVRKFRLNPWYSPPPCSTPVRLGPQRLNPGIHALPPRAPARMPRPASKNATG